MFDKKLLDVIVCPISKQPLELNGKELWCKVSGMAYPIRDGIPVLLVGEARKLGASDI